MGHVCMQAPWLGDGNKPRRQNAGQVTRTGPALWGVGREGAEAGSRRSGGKGAGPQGEVTAVICDCRNLESSQNAGWTEGSRYPPLRTVFSSSGKNTNPVEPFHTVQSAARCVERFHR